MADLFRIANAGGYWGDDPTALRRQVEGPLPLDAICIDYLAELTMSILQKQRQKDPALGYATDFLRQIEPLLERVVEKGIRIITNAGGVNPKGCADALGRLAQAKGLRLRIAVVEGDDLLGDLDPILEAENLAHLETGEPFLPFRSRALAANAYFGAWPVARALEGDPHIVLCGRVTDTGLTLGPLMHAFGWKPDAWDRLAAGIVAGHLLECGAQATGGNFTDWTRVPSFVDVGFPIAECRPDGSFVITKQPGSGGLVSCQTLREQLLYEMGDPASYLTPDVVADFRGLCLEQVGPDRVEVKGAKGRPPTDRLKVSAAFQAGYRVSGSLLISGPDARAKADAVARAFWIRLDAELARLGREPLVHRSTECLGHDACHRSLTPAQAPTELLLRLGARSEDSKALEFFRKLLPSLILSGPSGVAVTGGAPAVSEVVGYWPALVRRAPIQPRLTLMEAGPDGLHRLQEDLLAWPSTPGPQPPLEMRDPFAYVPASGDFPVRLPLLAIAHARSGDKGDTANIGLIGRSPECYAWMRDHVDAGRVKAWFSDLCRGSVHRYAVPHLWALNFLLEESLGGGGTLGLGIDPQGKTLAQALLRCPVEVPSSLLATIPPEAAHGPSELLGPTALPR